MGVRTMTQENKLDYWVNKVSFKIVNEKIISKNQIDKMLGILVQDGVYAWWIYTKKELGGKSDEDKNLLETPNLIKLLNQFCDFVGIPQKDKISSICQLQNEIEKFQNKIREESDDNNKKRIRSQIKQKKEEQNKLMNEFFEELSQDIYSLLFFREILEKILIYARYHAKAMEDNNE